MTFLAVPVVVSAFCLFLVQPLIAKQILPWFGGTASIWAVCMVFYQVMLLAGYLYAHGLARFLKPRMQAAVHAAVVGLSLAALPVGLQGLSAPAPGSDHPGSQVVLILLRAIGIPYFVLSATSPLMQSWYSRLQPGGRAYKLFGWSNLSCALALLSFPFLVEPLLPLSTLNIWWSWGYAGAAICLGVAAAILWKSNPDRETADAETETAPALVSQAQWLGYSALGSALLLGVTNHLCQTVAPIPFLWTVPLLLYLLTFVACFEREWYTRGKGMVLAGAALLAMAWALVYLPTDKTLMLGIPIFCAGVFFGCFYCHGELASRKPHEGHLTQFYIVLAAGGALGSWLVAFGAPIIFSAYSELPVAMSLCALTILFSIYDRSLKTDILATAVAILVTAPAASSLFGGGAQLAAGRNFYGSLRVEEIAAAKGSPALRKMIHGNITHGAQYVHPEMSRTPLSYYSAQSGVGLALAKFPSPRRLGVIGLGTGTLAAYGREGDTIRIYEINPLVVDYAKRYFSYLGGTRAKVDILLGDGRLLLEAEQDQRFDVLAVDAFSGDAIPVHLLTRQAMRLYLRHIKPDGVIALHVSNLFLELQPVVRALAESEGMRSLAYFDSAAQSEFRHPSSWALIGSQAVLDKLGMKATTPANGPLPRLWTDDYSTLLPALR